MSARVQRLAIGCTLLIVTIIVCRTEALGQTSRRNQNRAQRVAPTRRTVTPTKASHPGFQNAIRLALRNRTGNAGLGLTLGRQQNAFANPVRVRTFNNRVGSLFAVTNRQSPLSSGQRAVA